MQQRRHFASFFKANPGGEQALILCVYKVLWMFPSIPTCFSWSWVPNYERGNFNFGTGGLQHETGLCKHDFLSPPQRRKKGEISGNMKRCYVESDNSRPPNFKKFSNCNRYQKSVKYAYKLCCSPCPCSRNDRSNNLQSAYKMQGRVFEAHLK